jgi:cobyrinic acid a,c-diamide synthase
MTKSSATPYCSAILISAPASGQDKTTITAILADNVAMKKALQVHHQAGKPIYAECGGFLYVQESLPDKDGHSAEMAGLLPGSAQMQKRLVNLGMHSFHHSQRETTLQPFTASNPQHNRSRSENFYRVGSLQASYLRHYFPFNPQIAAGFSYE